jgi:hypothetical protein
MLCLIVKCFASAAENMFTYLYSMRICISSPIMLTLEGVESSIKSFVTCIQVLYLCIAFLCFAYDVDRNLIIYIRQM